ncbi:MAG: LysR family transcriptional regulator, partial [Eggerthellaceae bacterium]|nr:LysR family transcriptional regulator [Eggerthellaceae bacterium]
MDIQQLKYFLDVAQTEHMTRSAKRLNIAQPALSRSVSRLEHELGVSLFDREGRGLQLTDEGRLFQRKLIPLLNELDSICQEIKGVHAENREVRVHLGAASHIAADAVASWMSAAPNRRISLSQTASRDTEPD